MRTLTPAMIQALTGQETTEVFVFLITIEHATLSEPLRFSSDPTERVSTTPLLYKTVSRGDDYFYVPMGIVLPEEVEGSGTVSKLQVSNVGREQIELLRSISDRAQVTVELVLASDPDDVGLVLPVLDLTTASWDSLSLELTLSVESLDMEPWPSGNFDPASFPALH